VFIKVFHYLIVFLEVEELGPFVTSMLISMKYAYIAEIKSIMCSTATTCRLQRPVISYDVQFFLKLVENLFMQECKSVPLIARFI